MKEFQGQTGSDWQIPNTKVTNSKIIEASLDDCEQVYT